MNRALQTPFRTTLLLLASALCSPWGRPAEGAERAQQAALAPPPRGSDAASCRIHNFLPGGVANVGSGTLVDVAPDGARGLVLTCAHLFTEGAGRVVVEFPSGTTHDALLAAIDHDADLAALEIASPSRCAVDLNLQPARDPVLRACGFGSGGDYRCLSGRVLGYSAGPGQHSVRLSGAVRSGDSGGGVFDADDRLCAVVWGAAEGVTYASAGRPLRQFLARLLAASRLNASDARPSKVAVDCPDGQCPLLRPGIAATPPATRPPGIGAGRRAGDGGDRVGLPLRPLAPSNRCDCSAQLAAIARRLEGLEQTDASGGNPLRPPGSFGAVARAAAAFAATTLGLSGPMGWGVIAAAAVGGWIVGRRLKRRQQPRLARRVAREKRPTETPASHRSPLATHAEATAAAAAAFQPAAVPAAVDVRQPIERDDVEARQLLRLSQLEGRDPLQDALAGRLALDRLDALAEGSADPGQQQWADHLRRELRDRFNEVAPTKFVISAES